MIEGSVIKYAFPIYIFNNQKKIWQLIYKELFVINNKNNYELDKLDIILDYKLLQQPEDSNHWSVISNYYNIMKNKSDNFKYFKKTKPMDFNTILISKYIDKYDFFNMCGFKKDENKSDEIENNFKNKVEELENNFYENQKFMKIQIRITKEYVYQL